MGTWFDRAWIRADPEMVRRAVRATGADTVTVRAGAPGWAVVDATPTSWLALPDAGPPRLDAVCRALGAPGLHYSVMDSTSDRLVECDGAGSFERWGLWDTASGPPPGWTPDHASARVTLIDLSAERARVSGHRVAWGALTPPELEARLPPAVRAARARMVTRLEAAGATWAEGNLPGWRTWHLDAEAVVAILEAPDPPDIGADNVARALDAALSGLAA